MKLDFAALSAGQISYSDFVRDVTPTDLGPLTNEFFAAVEATLGHITDADVTFVPDDSTSQDTNGKGWPLSHIIVHFTATLEGASALAAMLARGVLVESQLRYEMPWETVTTVQQLHARLSESRRMSHAFLAVWPDPPHLDISVVRVPAFGPLNAIGAHILGITHGQSHLDQLRDVVRQAKQSVAH